MTVTDPDEAARVRLAAGLATSPNTLLTLAADAAVTVRAAVAINPAAPMQVDQLLADDPNTRVRTLLARKLAILIPSLTGAECEHLQRQARTDPLTGLLNRRAFLDEMARRVDRLERDGLPGTLMFIDLDNFKELNDRSGHDVGDEALCITAALLRSTLRPADLVARLGGDEFAMWLDGADEFTAAERAESLRIEGPKSLIHLADGHDLSLTMSIGITTRWPGRGEDIETLIHRADQAMYQVKRAGRGHWRVAQPSQP